MSDGARSIIQRLQRLTRSSSPRDKNDLVWPNAFFPITDTYVPPFKSHTSLRSPKRHQSTSDENKETKTLNLSRSSTVFYITLYNNNIIISFIFNNNVFISIRQRPGRLNIGGNDRSFNFSLGTQKRVTFFMTF